MRSQRSGLRLATLVDHRHAPLSHQRSSLSSRDLSGKPSHFGLETDGGADRVPASGAAAAFLRVVPTVRRLLAEAERRKADHLLVSGDLTALALPEEFEQAKEALSSWHGRMTIIPGNHDRYTPQAARDALFEKAFAEELESDLPEHRREGPFPIVKLVGTDAAVIGLSSARVPLMPGIAAGWVGARQREGLTAALADPRLRERAVFVAVHHAPFRESGQPDRLNHGLTDRETLLEILSSGGALALGHGHIHHRYRTEGPAGLSIFCAGSSTQAGREGYWIYELFPGKIGAAEPVTLA